MRIADLIAALQAGRDPDQAVIQASMPGVVGDAGPASVAAASPGIRPEYLGSGFMPPIPGQGGAAGPSPTAAPPPPTTSAPQGVKTPVTNPQDAVSTPMVAQSPPDLANMYLELMKKNENAKALDSGFALMAAGLSPYASTREALIRGAFGGSGRAGFSADDFVKIQGLQLTAQKQRLKQAAMTGLMKQYNLTPETIQYLEASDKLDEVIKHHNTLGIQVIEDAATGQKMIYNSAGKFVADAGGPKPPEIKTVETHRGPIPYDPQKVTLGAPIGGEKPRETQLVKDETSGREFLVYKDTGEEVREVVPTRKPGVKVSEDDDKLAAINVGRAAAGKPPMDMEYYLRNIKGKQGTVVNVGDQGQKFPAPPQGFDYTRNEDGTVKVEADGRPRLYAIEGGKGSAELTREQAEAQIAAHKAKQASEAEIKKARQQFAAVSTVIASADDAINILDKSPTLQPPAGFGHSLGYLYGGSPTINLRAKLDEIKPNVAFNQLQAMRDASPTGAALGPVSDFENKLLSSVFGSLDQAQDPKQLKEAILKIKTSMIVLAENKFTPENVADYQKKFDQVLAEIRGEQKGAGGSVIRQTKPPR